MDDIELRKRNKRWEMDPLLDAYDDDNDEIEIQHIPKKNTPPTFEKEEMNDVPVSDFDVFANPKKMYTEEDEVDRMYQEDSDEPDGSVDHDFDASEDEIQDKRDTYEDPNRPSPGYKSILDEKVDLLSKIYSCQAKGMNVRSLDTTSSIQEIRFEHHRLKREMQLKSSNKFCQSALMTCVNGLEMINSKYNPWKLRLDGFSQYTYENINEYDNVFEKLHDKYSSYVEIGPEYELFLLLSANAFIFHMSNTLTQSPNLAQAVQNNPDLMKSVFKTMGEVQKMDNEDERKKEAAPASRPPDLPISTRGMSAPSRSVERYQNLGEKEMAGPQFDLSGFQLPTGLMGLANQPPTTGIRPTLLPPKDATPPEPPIETRPPRVIEEDVGELDSLAGSDLEDGDVKQTPAPKSPAKKKSRAKPKKTKETSDNVIEI